MKGPTVTEVEEVLEEGRWAVAPASRYVLAMETCRAVGVASVAWDLVFRCFDPRDSASLVDAVDRTCRSWLFAPADGSDLDGEVCSSCGREHFGPRRTQRRATVHIDREGCIAWINRLLLGLDSAAVRLREGVAWRLVVGYEELVVVWLDESLGTRLVNRAFALSGPVLYVTTAPRTWSARVRDDPLITPISLATWIVRGSQAIQEWLSAWVQSPALAAEPALRLWANDRSPDSMVLHYPLGARILVLTAKGATLEGIDVLGSDATGVLPLLRFFVERWREDIVDGKAPDAHCTWLPEEIRVDGDAASRPDTVRRQITRLRSGISARYIAATGLPIGEKSVIDHVEGAGYRLQPNVLARILP